MAILLCLPGPANPPSTLFLGKVSLQISISNTKVEKLIDYLISNEVKAIGLGVNETQVCEDALNIGQWDVFLLAGRYTLLEQSPLERLFPACKKAGTSIICGGPFNSGLLVGRETWNYSKAPENLVNKTRKLANVADEFNIPLGAAALQFPQAHQIVSSVIPGPRSELELLEIISWQETKIPMEFWTSLKDKNLLDIDAPTPQ